MATRLDTSTTATSSGILIAGSQGSALASASSITISDSCHEVTGSTTVNTINGGRANMLLLLWKNTGATWALGSSGNIKAGAAVPAALRFVWLYTPDGTTWYADSGAISVSDGTSDFLSVAETGGVVTISLGATPLPIANGGTSAATATAGFNALSPTTTRGDIIYQNSAGDDARLAVGATGTVLIGGTDPSYSANPTVTTLTASGVVASGAGSAAAPGVAVGTTNKGLYEIGASELGLAIAGAAALTLNATRLAPVTNLGSDLGSANKFWSNEYVQDRRGWRIASGLSTTSATTQTIAHFTIPSGAGSAFIIAANLLTTDGGGNLSVRTSCYACVAVNKAGTITTATSSMVATNGVSANAGITTSGFPITLADAGSNVCNIQVAPAWSAGTPTAVTVQYSITFLYGDYTLTEDL